MMRAIAPENKFTVTQRNHAMAGSPPAKGWYHSVASIAATAEGLVVVYRRSDAHTCRTSDIMVAYSEDGGRNWGGHKSISHKDVYKDNAIWVAPQLSRLRDGRLVIICDLGQRNPQQNWPTLVHWQKPDRGMQNHLFWSADNGKTWDGPHEIDKIGGEPGYIIELSDGTLVYTRTESQKTNAIWDPPKNWGNNYYRNVAVFSDDGGKTWERTSIVADDPLQGDCEVGLVELSPRVLLAVTRVGLSSGSFGQPSRFIYSYDNGQTWQDHTLAPFYGQRTVIGKLASGKLLVTFRNRWGTPASYVFVFDPDEQFGFQPSSFILDESRCVLENNVMIIKSGEGSEKAVDFSLYPAQAPSSRVEIEAELMVKEADVNGCMISAGCWVRFEPDRVSLIGRAEDRFAVDNNFWHKYRIVRENGQVSIFADGELRLERPTDGIETRFVHFGNKTGKYTHNSSLSMWRSISASVHNENDHSIDWQWNASRGYPDQFRRDRIVRLDYSARGGDSGYSGWTQMADGTIVIADYTNETLHSAKQPFVRVYVTNEDELTG